MDFIDTPEDMHPYECDHEGHCIHCDRTVTASHDPDTCALCHPELDDGVPTDAVHVVFNNDCPEAYSPSEPEATKAAKALQHAADAAGGDRTTSYYHVHSVPRLTAGAYRNMLREARRMP